MNMRRTHAALYRPLPEDPGGTGSETPNGGGGAPGVTPKPAPTPEQDKTFGQADVDRIVAERVARERAKYADHDDLRKAAKRLEEIEAANATDLEKAVKAAREEGRAEVLSAANQRTLNAEARALAAAAKFRNPVLAVRAIDLGDVRVAEDGTVDAAAIKTRLAELASAEPYLVDDGTVTPGRPKPDDAQGQPGGNPDRAAEGVAEARRRFGPKAGAQH
jgi:hypothetical protein